MNEMLFVPITTVINRLSGERENQKVAYINVQVASIDQIEAGNEEVRTLLKRAHGGVEDFEIYNRKDRMQQMEQQGKVYDVTFMVCGTISLLVGGIVIMNIMLASFNERVREVGTRKALGASPIHIAAQFLVESVLVTMAGGLIGVFTGIGFCRIMASLLQQTMTVTPSMMATGFFCAVVVGIFFGFYPAIRAARLSPVEALRYE
jgi:putative ABC transport system permease protein